jgi:hypothetical protein
VPDRRWLRWGANVLVADLVVHTGGGILMNDWEGWDVFWTNVTFVLVTGLVLVGATYGLLVRWALRPSARGNRPAGAALAAGGLSVLAYGVFFTWAPVVIAPAAILLGREGSRRTVMAGDRRLARIGVALGVVTLAVFASFVLYSLISGHYPFGL